MAPIVYCLHLLSLLFLAHSCNGLPLNAAELVSAVETTSEVTTSDMSAVESSSHGLEQSYLVTETPREIREEIDYSVRLAGIIIDALAGISIILFLIGYVVYKQCLRRNITRMNFEDPVYRKTTEDQFSLEKNRYQPARSYPSIWNWNFLFWSTLIAEGDLNLLIRFQLIHGEYLTLKSQKLWGKKKITDLV